MHGYKSIKTRSVGGQEEYVAVHVFSNFDVCLSLFVTANVNAHPIYE